MQRPGNTREQDARRKAEDRFAKAARLDVESMKLREQRQSNDLAKMERLKALRLAKAAADKAAAATEAEQVAPAIKREASAGKAKRTVAAKPAIAIPVAAKPAAAKQTAAKPTAKK